MEFDMEGSIEVYYGYFTSKRSQIWALVLLLALAILSVVAALYGIMFLGEGDVDPELPG
jgi:hypothetical protein